VVSKSVTEELPAYDVPEPSRAVFHPLEVYPFLAIDGVTDVIVNGVPAVKTSGAIDPEVAVFES
jgi:hypothetical protein